MKNEINNIIIHNSTINKNIVNTKSSFEENLYFVLPDINLSDVLSNDEIQKILKDREMYEKLIKSNKFEMSNTKEFLSKLENDFNKYGDLIAKKKVFDNQNYLNDSNIQNNCLNGITYNLSRFFILFILFT